METEIKQEKSKPKRTSKRKKLAEGKEKEKPPILTPEIKLFGRWETKHIKVEDPGLAPYIDLTPIFSPRAAGRLAKTRFAKTKYNILERFRGKLMIPGHKGKKHFKTSGHCTGKSTHAYNIIIKTFLEIERTLNKNPIEVFIKAIENAAPREEITTIEYGGARYPQAVDCAPIRRIDVALRQFAQGAYSKAFGSKRKIWQTLSDEIIKAYNFDPASQAVAKKLELERQAEASR